MKLSLVAAALLLASCGPGVVDGIESIGNGYYLADSGGDGRTIEYHKRGERPRTVIGARVETYLKQGATVIVARRPASVVMKDGSPVWQVSAACEYWIIDTESRTERVTADEREYGLLRCGG